MNSRVPGPLPTACYASQDQFISKSDAALTVVSAEHSAQNQINDQASRSVSQVDPMELARRMPESAFMQRCKNYFVQERIPHYEQY